MKKVKIIAEAGVNHNGNLEMAKKMVEVAADCGANAIKFQTFLADEIVTKNLEKASYQKLSSKPIETQYSMLKKLELGVKDHFELAKFCQSMDIEFMSSPFSVNSAKLLIDLGVSTIKIASGEVTNIPLLEYVSHQDVSIVISTGMCTIDEVIHLLQFLEGNGKSKEKITFLHCSSAYPTQPSDVNLRAINTLSLHLGTEVGFSDHTEGIDIAIGAVAIGAKIIEKHFTLDPSLDGPDQNISLSPDRLKKMITSIRRVEASLGNGCKKPNAAESENLQLLRKKVVAKRFIAKGEKFTELNIDVKRSNSGISSLFYKSVLGRIAEQSYQYDEGIKV